MCPKCIPEVPLDPSKGQRVLEHMASHVIFDKSIRRRDEPCGLCLRPSPMCALYFKKGAGTGATRQVDWTRSNCVNIVNFRMAAAVKSSESSPCTNYPMKCPLCDNSAPAVWSYNLEAHLSGTRHNLASADRANAIYQISEAEENRMKKLYDKRFIYPKARISRQPKMQLPLVFSEAHSSRMALL